MPAITRLRARLLAFAAATGLLATLELGVSPASAYVTNYGCTANSGSTSCLSDLTSNPHTYMESRAMKSGAAADRICAQILWRDSLGNWANLPPYNSGPCATNTTFQRSCFDNTSTANRIGGVSGSGPWWVDGRAATANDTNCVV